MIDEKAKKVIRFGIVIFIMLSVLAIVGFFAFKKNTDLPPVESTTPQGSETSIPETKEPEEAAPVTKNGIRFMGFNTLQNEPYFVTDERLDVIRFYLAEYAQSSTDTSITTFTYTQASANQEKANQATIITFLATDNNNEAYKVQLSYTYAADAYVTIYDKNDQVIQSSPHDND